MKVRVSEHAKHVDGPSKISKEGRGAADGDIAAHFDSDRDALLCDLNAEVASLRRQVEELRSSSAANSSSASDARSGVTAALLAHVLIDEEKRSRAVIESCVSDLFAALQLACQSCIYMSSTISTPTKRECEGSNVVDVGASGHADSIGDELLRAHDYRCAREVCSLYGEVMQAYSILLRTHARQSTAPSKLLVDATHSIGPSIGCPDESIGVDATFSGVEADNTCVLANDTMQQTLNDNDEVEVKPLSTTHSALQPDADDEVTQPTAAEASSAAVSVDAEGHDVHDDEHVACADGVTGAEDALLAELRQTIELDDGTDQFTASSLASRGSADKGAIAEAQLVESDDTDSRSVSEKVVTAEAVMADVNDGDDDTVERSTALGCDTPSQTAACPSEAEFTASTQHRANSNEGRDGSAPDVVATTVCAQDDDGIGGTSISSHAADTANAMHGDIAEVERIDSSDEESSVASQDDAHETTVKKAGSRPDAMNSVATSDISGHVQVASSIESTTSSEFAQEKALHNGVAGSTTFLLPRDAPASSHTITTPPVSSVPTMAKADPVAMSINDAAKNTHVVTNNLTGVNGSHVNDNNVAARSPAAAAMSYSVTDDEDDAIDVGFDPFA